MLACVGISAPKAEKIFQGNSSQENACNCYTNYNILSINFHKFSTILFANDGQAIG